MPISTSLDVPSGRASPLVQEQLRQVQIYFSPQLTGYSYLPLQYRCIVMAVVLVHLYVHGTPLWSLGMASGSLSQEHAEQITSLQCTVSLNKFNFYYKSCGPFSFHTGGITTLVDMPLNSFPSTVSEETLKMKVRFLCQLQVPYTVATCFMSVIDTAITSLKFSWKQLKISYMLMWVS